MKTTDELVALITHLTAHPSMYLTTDSDWYMGVVTFLHGFDYAMNGSILAGFDEWLCVKFDKKYNVPWDVIIASETLGEFAYQRRPWPAEADNVLLESLRDQATTFLVHRGTVGLRNVLYDHGKWMREKSWFDENVERYGRSDGAPHE
jgi:hypothetical protein